MNDHTSYEVWSFFYAHHFSFYLLIRLFSGIGYKNDCIKGNNCKTPLEERNKVLQVAKKFIKQREEALERILSEEGILLRINRSIQAEVPLEI